jgi:hypothetical protein
VADSGLGKVESDFGLDMGRTGSWAQNEVRRSHDALRFLLRHFTH